MWQLFDLKLRRVRLGVRFRHILSSRKFFLTFLPLAAYTGVLAYGNYRAMYLTVFMAARNT